MPQVRVHPLVESELAEVRSWYSERSTRAMENFNVRFNRTLGRIAERPTAHAPWRKTIFRRARIPHYPYLLLFHASSRITSVLALAHQRRDPGTVLTTIRRRFANFA
ncbi:MAG: type II toxin-antitoxin system RelE/ParE family toxin [Verrucomicrobiota bacterium]